MSAAQRKFLVFSTGGKCYAFDLADVAEVMDPATCWPIPMAPQYYAGAINFHGAIVAVMDLAAFFGLESRNTLEKIIVLDVKVASLGFLVERVARIISEDGVKYNESPNAEPFAVATLSLPEGEATLLDIDAIIAEAANAVNGR